MSFEEADVLRERAEAFLRNAKHLIEVGEHDLAAFSAEQPFQLLLKYKLLLKTGTYPRTHSLTRLLRELGRLHPGKNLDKILEENLLLNNEARGCIYIRQIPSEEG